MNKPRLFLFSVGALALFALTSCGYHVVPPGFRGVQTRLGSLKAEPLEPGWYTTLIAKIDDVSVQQQTQEVAAECFSSDLQQVKVRLKILYQVPDASVVPIYRDYHGDPFDTLIAPRVQEAIKEVTATKTASEIVKSREEIKRAALAHSREKVGAILNIADLVIENVTLSRDLEAAIEAKMVQQQEAERATYREQQAETEAKIIVAKAHGEAEAIRIQGEALEKAPQLIQLRMVEKWNGVAPQVLGSDVKMLLPLPPSPKPAT